LNFYATETPRMSKAKAGQEADRKTKQSLHGVKNGSMRRNKDPKSKNMPTDKVALNNNSKAKGKDTAKPPLKTPSKTLQTAIVVKSKQHLSKNNQTNNSQTKGKIILKRKIFQRQSDDKILRAN